MVILRSGSTTESDFTNMTEQMTWDQFALFLIETCKSPDIIKMIKDTVAPKHNDFMGIVPAEVHRQMYIFMWSVTRGIFVGTAYDYVQPLPLEQCSYSCL